MRLKFFLILKRTKKKKKWPRVLNADQMILECTRRPEIVWFIQCISVIDVVVDLVRVKENMFIQQTSQRFFDVLFRLMWRRDIGQCQINVETTLCTKCWNLQCWAMSNQRCLFRRLIWTLVKVETTLSFLTSISSTLGYVEIALWIWPFVKKIKNKIRAKNKILLSFK